MRTRRSNQTKRYSIEQYDYGLSDDEEAQESRWARQADQDDENFGNGNNPGADQHAPLQDEQEIASEGDLTPGADEDEDPVNDRTIARVMRRRKTKHKTQPQPQVPEVPDSTYHVIPPYPQDVRATRVYNGPMKKWDRCRVLIDIYYGPEREHLEVMYNMHAHWDPWAVLPVKSIDHPGGVMRNPWLPDDFEALEKQRFSAWYERYRSDGPGLQRSHTMPSKNGQRLLPQADGKLVTLVGPAANQQRCDLADGQALSFQHNGQPLKEPASSSEESGGWMFNVGGIPLALAWAPQRGHVNQILALAVIPFKDQAFYATEEAKPAEDEMKAGCVQMWEFAFVKDKSGIVRPSKTPPRLMSAICFDWGRPKRIQWCPAPTSTASIYGILAVLSGGQVRIVSVKKYKSTTYDWIEAPMATLGLPDEHNTEATCLTWVNINRIVLGHADGSITLWSIRPRLLLQRHAVHVNHVLDICSGYPSYPFMIASNPVGGHPKLLDLNRPSGENTYFSGPIISFQPNLLQWCDLVQGFVTVYPTASPVSGVLAFMHVKHFAQPRTIYTGHSHTISLSVATSHAFLLVGSADGSLWSSNTLRKIVYDRTEKPYKIKIFQNEYRAVEDGKGGALPGDTSAAGRESLVRGAVRVLQGFELEVNENAKAKQVRAALEKQKKDNNNNTPKKKTKKRKKAKQAAEEPVVGEDGNAEDEAGPAAEAGDAEEIDMGLIDPRMTVYHENLTRISAVAWNPNVEFGWWGASAMASGLVRVQDLGVEPA